jgi:IS4 transposase
MRHQNSLLHQILHFVPWPAFDQLVAAYDADRGVRKLTTKSQFIALAYAQLAGAQSLREITSGLSSHAVRLYHVGAAVPARSTFADANANRPAQLFADLFALMTASATRGLRRHMREAVHLVDATSMRLTDLSKAWADYGSNGTVVKLHVDFDADRSIPVNIAITPARINDIALAPSMPIEAGATYVFDLGYYDFSWWSALDKAGCRFVTRLKAHTHPRILAERCVPSGGKVRVDRLVAIDARLKSARGARHPLSGIPLREIVVVTDDGRTLRLVTNDLDAPATEVAALYKARWQIELFFRWIKQHLRITRFLGTSENSVRIQIAVALIVFLVLRMAAEASRTPVSLLTFARLVRANLMQRRPLEDLHKPPPEIRSDPRQGDLALC